MNLSRITLAVKVFVAVVLFVNKLCLGSFPVSRWSKDCWKKTKSVFVASALYCLPFGQWEPLRIVEKRTKTSFVARLTPAQRSPLVTLHRARRLTGAFHKFFRICKKPFRGEAIITEIFHKGLKGAFEWTMKIWCPFLLNIWSLTLYGYELRETESIRS